MKNNAIPRTDGRNPRSGIHGEKAGIPMNWRSPSKVFDDPESEYAPQSSGRELNVRLNKIQFVVAREYLGQALCISRTIRPTSRRVAGADPQPMRVHGGSFSRVPLSGYKGFNLYGLTRPSHSLTHVILAYRILARCSISARTSCAMSMTEAATLVERYIIEYTRWRHWDPTGSRSVRYAKRGDCAFDAV